MNLNKNISVWRGNSVPPTDYHIWEKEDGSIYTKVESGWTILTSPNDKATLDRIKIITTELANTQIRRTEMGVANGVATLDNNGLIPYNQLPNIADDEDLVEIDSILRLKDRKCDPSNFGGKGYKIIRKNIEKFNLPTVSIVVSKAPTSTGNITITINSNVTTINLDRATDTTTTIVANKIATALKSSLDDYRVSVSSDEITLVRQNEYLVSPSLIDVGNTSAIISINDSISENIGKNILRKDMLQQPNTIYEIRYDFDLDSSTIVIPKNCVLYFTSGKFYNGNIHANNTIISSFYKDTLSEINISGNYYTVQKHIEYTKDLLQTSIDKLNDTVYPITLGFTVSPNTDTMQTDVKYSVTSDGKPLVPDTLEVTKQINDNASKVLTNAEVASGTVQTKIEGGREIFKFAVTKTGRTGKSTSATRYLCYYGSSSVKDMTTETMDTLSKVLSTGVSFNSQINTNNGEYIWLIVPDYLTISRVTSAGVDVTLAAVQTVTNSLGTFKAYRTANTLTTETWKLVIS